MAEENKNEDPSTEAPAKEEAPAKVEEKVADASAEASTKVEEAAPSEAAEKPAKEAPAKEKADAPQEEAADDKQSGRSKERECHNNHDYRHTHTDAGQCQCTGIRYMTYVDPVDQVVEHIDQLRRYCRNS